MLATKNIIISNIPKSVTKKEILTFIGKTLQIERIGALQNQTEKTYQIILTMNSYEEATRTQITYDGKYLNGQQIMVRGSFDR